MAGVCQRTPALVAEGFARPGPSPRSSVSLRAVLDLRLKHFDASGGRSAIRQPGGPEVGITSTKVRYECLPEGPSPLAWCGTSGATPVRRQRRVVGCHDDRRPRPDHPCAETPGDHGEFVTSASTAQMNRKVHCRANDPSNRSRLRSKRPGSFIASIDRFHIVAMSPSCNKPSSCGKSPASINERR